MSETINMSVSNAAMAAAPAVAATMASILKPKVVTKKAVKVEQPICIGDKVQAKKGGPVMTVVQIAEGKALCEFGKKGKPYQTTLYLEDLDRKSRPVVQGATVSPTTLDLK